MTSVYGYNTPGDMEVFYYKKKSRPNRGNIGGVMDALYLNPNTSIFAYIVERARLAWLIDGVEFKSTIFVPLNSEIMSKYSLSYIREMDDNLSFRIVMYSILHGKIGYQTLATLNYSALVPYKSHDRIEMTNIAGAITLNDTVRVFPIESICNNGVILYTDDFLIPYNYS